MDRPSEPDDRSGRLPPMNDLSTGRRLGVALLSLSLFVAACSSPAWPSAVPPNSPPPDAPVSAPPGGTDPGPGIGGKLVVPRPGQLDVHPVQADALAARVDGNKIVVTVTWTSGVEPCNILDSIVVDKGDATYTITLREGRGPEDIACIAIAEEHNTEFEIPDVAAGTWTIQDSGGRATPVEVTVG
ncbi:MAG: hypothetical protein ACXW4T_01055 [Candidatus Limnocylindrales bacterium]